MTFRLWRCFNQRHFYLPFYVSCLSRAFVQKQLISVLKSWTGRLMWRRRNIVQPMNNVSTVNAVTDSTAATSAKPRNIVLPTSNVSSTVNTAVTDSSAADSAKARTALAKKRFHPLRLGNAEAKKVESAPHVISSASTSPHVDFEAGGTFFAELGGRFDAYAGANGQNIQSHSHFIELDNCLSESKNCNQMKIQMKTLTKVAE